MANPKPVDLVVTEPLAYSGRHLARGEVLHDVPYEDAVELVGASRARLATPDDLASPPA